MRALIILTAISTIVEAFRVAIYYLRKDISLVKKILETILLMFMIVLCYMDLEHIGGLVNVILSILLSLYVLIMFIYERCSRNEYITVLSVKNGIDMSSAGIMFLDNNHEIILINNVMQKILDSFNIKKDYLEELKKNSFRKINNSYLLKINDLVYQLDITNDKEIILLDVTDLYKLREKEELQNKELEETNTKILDTINNIEKIEKAKNILKIKNEYHDLLGQRLALFTKYLEQDKKNVKDIAFLLDSIYDDKTASGTTELKKIIKMYKIIGVNINIKGELPEEEKKSRIFFEIIREAVSNAIIHADSKNIDVTIMNYLNRVEMTITNDGKTPNNIIHENEGIKGMRRKLKEINGSMTVTTNNNFCLSIKI